jgi:hypothetical protein
VLVKLHTAVLIPGTPAVPGYPETPARPGYTVCGPSTDGEWREVCSTVLLPLADGAIVLPPGVTNYEVISVDGIPLVSFYICRTEWVPAPGSGQTQCTDYPPQEYRPGKLPTPAVPARIEYQVELGWTAGANSEQALDGDVRCQFDMPAVVGVAVGLIPDIEGDVTNLDRLPHALYFFQDATARPRVAVMESGRLASADMPYAAGDVFDIRRVGGQVEYLHNGGRVHVSASVSIGPVRVGCALWASGDNIP